MNELEKIGQKIKEAQRQLSIAATEYFNSEQHKKLIDSLKKMGAIK